MARSTQSAIMAGASKKVKAAEKVKELKAQLKAAEKVVNEAGRAYEKANAARNKVAAKLLKLTEPVAAAEKPAEVVEVPTAGGIG